MLTASFRAGQTAYNPHMLLRFMRARPAQTCHDSSGIEISTTNDHRRGQNSVPDLETESQCAHPAAYPSRAMRHLAPAVLVLTATIVCAQKSQPSLKETFEWMHNAFPGSQSVSALRVGQTREFTFVQGKAGAPPSCVVTIAEHSRVDGKLSTRDTIIDLSLIDPESIKWYTDDTLFQDTGVLTMVATNDKKIIVEKVEGETDDKPYLNERVFITFIGPNYAQRFANAFKNAVTLCGGKASTF